MFYYVSAFHVGVTQTSSRSAVLDPKVFKSIYSDSLIYDFLGKEEELVLFINEKKTPGNRKKERLIEKLFLPVGLKCRKTWEYHFGIMDVDETMVLGELVIY